MLNATDKQLATVIINALSAGGFCLFGHSDDGLGTMTRELTARLLIDRLGGVDEESVIVFDCNGKRAGGLYFVWGNGAGEALADYAWSQKHPRHEEFRAIVESATEAL